MNPTGAKAAIKAFVEATQGNVVPEAIVQHRASICNRCPKRKVTRGVSRVSQLLGILSGKHKVPNEIANYSCGVCKCNMLLLLPATKENIHKDTEEERKERPQTCWILKL
jgi:hypothetical protein